MKQFWKKSALAAAALVSMSAAQAVIVTFNDPVPSSLVGHTETFTQQGFTFATYSNAAGAAAGDLVGAVIDGADLAGTCPGLICTSVGATGIYYGLLNDAFVSVFSSNPSLLISISALSAGFIGNAGDTYSATRSGQVVIQGVRPNNTAVAVSASLGLPDAQGNFAFSNITLPASFAAEQFSFLQIYGRYCPSGSTTCTAFTTNKAQIALDNLNVTAVPEPATWGLMGLGMLGIAAVARRRRAA